MFDKMKRTKSVVLFLGCLLITTFVFTPARGADKFLIVKQPPVNQSKIAAVQPKHILEQGMIFVDGGTFQMGDPAGDARPEDKPVRSVILRNFYIKQYEVTFDEYDVFRTATNRTVSAVDFENFGRGQRPVIRVSWLDAVAYCNWLSEKYRLTPAYQIKDLVTAPYVDVTCNFTCNGFRLPTEAEWEFCAKGGVKSRNYTYSGGNIAEDVAWCLTNSEKKTQPVGLKQPNELDLYDMSGNAAEWCWDWYRPSYLGVPTDNPTGVLAGELRVIRGGSWAHSAFVIRPVKRMYGDPLKGNGFTGFRIVSTAP